MENEQKRDFEGIWIPRGIWLDKELNALDKIIFVEIDSLDATEEGCYASNKYLAEFCQCTETKISTSIKKLSELGYIEIVNFDGRKRFIKSRLKKIERQTLKNLKADFKKIKDNNIYNNIDNNIINKKENIKRKIFKKPTIEEINEYCKERNNGIDAEAFYDFYESKDWYVGKNKMKDWKACVRTWEKRNKSKEEKLPEWWNKTNKDFEEDEDAEFRAKAEAIRNGTYEP